MSCTTDDVALLVTAGKLRPLGRPNLNAVKFFRAVELIALLADRDWLDDATKTIGQYWKRKNGVITLRASQEVCPQTPKEPP